MGRVPALHTGMAEAAVWSGARPVVEVPTDVFGLLAASNLYIKAVEDYRSPLKQTGS